MSYAVLPHLQQRISSCWVRNPFPTSELEHFPHLKQSLCHWRSSNEINLASPRAMKRKHGDEKWGCECLLADHKGSNLCSNKQSPFLLPLINVKTWAKWSEAAIHWGKLVPSKNLNRTLSPLVMSCPLRAPRLNKTPSYPDIWKLEKNWINEHMWFIQGQSYH